MLHAASLVEQVGPIVEHDLIEGDLAERQVIAKVHDVNSGLVNDGVQQLLGLLTELLRIVTPLPDATACPPLSVC